MTTIKLHGKTFEQFISADEIDTRLKGIVKELTLFEGPEIPIFLGILNGAVLFHADLIRRCDKLLEVAYLRTRSYQGMKSTGKVSIDWPVGLDFTDRKVVIVEDIVDSGLTLATLTAEIKERGASSVTTVVLLDKPAARKVNFVPDVIGFEIPDRFVVGYGLDYNGLGRNLPAVYQLKEERV